MTESSQPPAAHYIANADGKCEGLQSAKRRRMLATNMSIDVPSHNHRLSGCFRAWRLLSCTIRATEGAGTENRHFRALSRNADAVQALDKRRDTARVVRHVRWGIEVKRDFEETERIAVGHGGEIA